MVTFSDILAFACGFMASGVYSGQGPLRIAGAVLVIALAVLAMVQSKNERKGWKQEERRECEREAILRARETQNRGRND